MSEQTMPPLAGSELEAQGNAAVEQTLDGLLRVVVHNDEATPYAYVIQTLGSVFMLSEELAEHIAWTAHTKGSAVVVVRPRREAETLAKIARGRAKVDGFPLAFTLEQET